VSLHTAVPSAPRADDPASPRAALRGASRDRRAVLSPWGGTAPNPAPPSGRRRTRIPPCRPCADDRPTRAPSGARPETAVPSYPRGAARLLPAAPTAPATRRRDRRVALPPRHGAWPAASPPGGAARGRRVVPTPWAGAAPGSPRRRWAAWLGPPCRPRRGEEGDTAW